MTDELFVRDNLPDFLRRFETDRDALTRALPPAFAPARPARPARLREFYGEWQTALDALDFDALTREGQADAALFRSLLRGEIDDLAIADRRRDETAALLPFAAAIADMDETRRAMTAPDPARCAETLHRLTEQIKALTKTVTDTSVVGTVTGERAARTIGEIRDVLGLWFRFFDAYDPLFTWWLREPYPLADTALADYAHALRGTTEGTPADDEHIVGDPIGADALLAALRGELIPYTPDELIAIGEREYAWCETEMIKAANELGFGGNWRDALEMVKTRHVAPGEQPALVRALADEAIAFVTDRDLVTVPPLAREIWRMTMMTPEWQKKNPFFLGGETIYVSFPTAEMSQERKRMSLRGNNRHFARATVQHELIPGHHLQLFMAQRYRTHRRIFDTPFYLEGWAIHWEFLLWDSGFAASPEDRIGMLFWRMHRCVRVAFSLRYHLGQLTASECVEMLVERVGHERENALAEVRRSLSDDYPPLYQAAYLLGGLQMRALYRELAGSGRLTPRAFHDAVLQSNSVPIALLRTELMGLPIPRDLSDLNWRFYDPNEEIEKEA
ncbi:MAG: DUF885 family protein [Armatimonadota bacterium]